VRAGGRAAVGVVAKGVNVHATLGVGIVARDVEGDGGSIRLRGLLEGDGALDVRVSTENCDYNWRRSLSAVAPMAFVVMFGGWLLCDHHGTGVASIMAQLIGVQ